MRWTMPPACSDFWLADTPAMELLHVRAEDGTRLACWDFGGGGQPVLMLHGTGLHGRCWAPVAGRLAEDFRPLAVDMRGHGASGQSRRGSYDWELFATDVLAVLDQLGLTGTGAVGVGHSAGATALLLAEAARPATFASLWGWEPIMAVPGTEMTARNSAEFASRARRRRAHFGSPEEARAHFEGRGQFAEFRAGVAGSLSIRSVRRNRRRYPKARLRPRERGSHVRVGTCSRRLGPPP